MSCNKVKANQVLREVERMGVRFRIIIITVMMENGRVVYCGLTEYGRVKVIKWYVKATIMHTKA